MGKLVENIRLRSPLRESTFSDGETTLSLEKLVEEIEIFTSHFNIHFPGMIPKIGLIVDQSVPSCITLLSLIDLEAPFLLLDDLLTVSELTSLVDKAGISVLIVPPGDKYSSLSERGIGVLTYDELDRPMDRQWVPKVGEECVPRYLNMLTTGTTGSPKLSLIPYSVLWREAAFYKDWYPLHTNDNVISTVPIFHYFGLTASLLGSLFSGSSLWLCRKPSPRRLADMAETHAATVIYAVPQMLDMLNQSHMIASNKLAALRFAITAGSKLPIEVADAFQKKFDSRILQVYGSTETGCIAAEHPNQPSILGSVGYVVPGVRVQLGEQNRLSVKSDSLFYGYQSNDEVIRPFEDGWFVTNDMGEMKDGMLSLKGRVMNIINKSGKKIDPQEVSNVLCQHPCIDEARVQGVGDPLVGEKIVATVVASSVVSESELRVFLAEHLAEYKHPQEIHFVDCFPKSWKTSYIEKDD